MRTKTLILAAVLLAPALALATGYAVPHVQPRDLSLLQSAIAAQQEASATAVNPAALSKLEGLNLSLAGSILTLSTSWKAPAGSALSGSDNTNLSPVTPVSLFAAYGTRLGDRGLGVGFGMNNPAGGNQHWDEDWVGRGRIITTERRVYAFYLNAGYEVLPELLRVGGGAIYYHGTQYLKQGVEPVRGAFGELAVKGGAFSYELALEVTPLRGVPLSIGVDYKHKAHMHQTGDGNFAVPPALEGPATQDQGVDTDLTMPNLFGLGVAYRVIRPLRLTAAYTFERFVVYKEDRFVGDRGLVLTVPRDYRNGFGIRFGAEWDLNPVWTVRTGIVRDLSGLRTAHYSPTLPDSDAWGTALGASWRVLPDLSVNGTFYFASRDEVTSTEWRSATNPGGSFPGTYKTYGTITSLGVTWRPTLGR